MGFDWQFEDDHASVTQLDKVFTNGNAARLAGMLRSLERFDDDSAAGWIPQYLDIHKIEVLAGNDGEYRTHDYELVQASQPGGLACDRYSILKQPGRPHLDFDMFFYHADVLSGQDVGSISSGTDGGTLAVDDGGFAESTVNSIENARMGTSHDVWFDFRKMFDRNNGTLWGQWTDDAGKAARSKCEDLEKWHGTGDDDDYRQLRLFQLSELTVQFAATIHAARVNLNSLMGDVVRRAEAWNNSSTPGQQSFAWIFISSIAGLSGESPAKSPMTTAVNFVDALGDVVSAAKGGYPGLDAVTCYGIFSDYLQKANDLLQAVSEKVDGLVTKLQSIREGIPEVPQWGA